MKNLFVKIFVILLVLSVFSAIKAQDNKYAGSFLELGVGARAMGMGVLLFPLQMMDPHFIGIPQASRC